MGSPALFGLRSYTLALKINYIIAFFIYNELIMAHRSLFFMTDGGSFIEIRL